MYTAYGRKEEGEEEEKVAYKKNSSFNEMWVMPELKPGNPFITNDKTEEEFVKNFLESSHKWKIANPDASVNIWYDSTTVTKEQIEATQRILNEKATKDPTWDIKLKNVREIEVVKNNPFVFSKRIPFYEVVDLLKLAICLHETEVEGKKVAFFVDLQLFDLRPQGGRPTIEELIFSDKAIKNNFEKYGLMQNDNKKSSWLENQYYQVLNKPQTLLAIKIYMNHILDCIQTALNLKWDIRGEDNKFLRERALTDLSGMVYGKQSLLFTLIQALNDPDDTIKIIEPSGKIVEFDPEKHKIFGNFHDRNACERKLQLGVMDTVDNWDLPIYLVNVDTVKNQQDIKQCGSSIIFPASALISLEVDDEVELPDNEDIKNIKKKFSQDCKVRIGHIHKAKISELDTTTAPPEGGYRVVLISTLPRETRRSKPS